MVCVGIGNRLRMARERAGLQQKQLAEMIDVAPSSITNYENETSHPKEEKLYALMKALDVDANYLFADVMAELGITKSPPKAEALNGDIGAHLTELLLRSGMIAPGRDLTKGQADALIGVGAILSQIFNSDLQ